MGQREVKFKIEDMKKRETKVTNQGARKKTRLEEEAIEKRLQRLRGNL